MRIVAFPYYSDNPYLDLLYADAVALGATVSSPTGLDDAVAQFADLGAGDVLHLHWTTPICQPYPTAAEAKAALKRFTRAVRGARRRGARFLWTVHNVHPHEMPYPALEARLTRWILRHADDVIVLSAHTAEAVASAYRLPPAKVRLLPHSAYTGVYPDDVDGGAARARLGVTGSGPVIAFVGEQRPYKGIPELVSAFHALRRTHPDATLLLGGRIREQDRPQLEALVRDVDGIVTTGERIADEDLQLWFRAADAMVFPYRVTLNSGSMFLAATFGTPCVLPDAPALREWKHERWIRFFTPDDDPAAAIAAAVIDLLHDQDAAAAAARFAAAHPPAEMSQRYSALLGLRPAGSTQPAL